MADKTVDVLACENCGSQSLSWAPSIVNESDVVDGRLRVHDVSCVFALGCDECSETLHVISADAAAAKLTAITELMEHDEALREALATCERWFTNHSPTAPLIGGQGEAEHPMLTMLRAVGGAK